MYYCIRSEYYLRFNTMYHISEVDQTTFAGQHNLQDTDFTFNLNHLVQEHLKEEIGMLKGE